MKPSTLALIARMALAFVLIVGGSVLAQHWDNAEVSHWRAVAEAE